jgi:hypothetical protein
MGSLHARGIGFNASLPDVLEFEMPLSLKIAEFRHVHLLANLPPVICLLNANDLKVQNAPWSADGYLVANPVAQQGLAYGGFVGNAAPRGVRLNRAHDLIGLQRISAPFHHRNARAQTYLVGGAAFNNDRLAERCFQGLDASLNKGLLLLGIVVGGISLA